MKEFHTETSINTAPEKVWDALVNPDKIAQYMFGSRAESSWQKGDDLKFYMEKDGHRALVVHGSIVEIEKPRLLEHTLFPSTWDMEDIPENYLTVRYLIRPEGSGSKLEITQTGFENAAQGEKRYKDVMEGWKAALPKLKEVAEKA